MVPGVVPPGGAGGKVPALQAGLGVPAGGGEDRKSVGSGGPEPNEAPGLCAGGEGRSLIGGQEDMPTPGFGGWPPSGEVEGKPDDDRGACGTEPPTGLNGSGDELGGSDENILVNSPGPPWAGGAAGAGRGGAGGDDDAGVSNSLVKAPASLAGGGGGAALGGGTTGAAESGAGASTVGISAAANIRVNSPGGFAAGGGGWTAGAGVAGCGGAFTSLMLNMRVNSPGSFAAGAGGGGGSGPTAGGGGPPVIGDDAGEKAVARVPRLWASRAARASAMLKTFVNSPGSFPGGCGGGEAGGGGGEGGGGAAFCAGGGTPMEAAEKIIVGTDSGGAGLAAGGGGAVDNAGADGGAGGAAGGAGGVAGDTATGPCKARSSQAARLSKSGNGQLTTNGTPSCSAESMNRLRLGSGSCCSFSSSPAPCLLAPPGRKWTIKAWPRVLCRA